ncbi:MAG: UDP-N-acetylglucosamine diphosphorylase/glucosamine-1-phosphate N-acetyltransferase [Deferribacteres bacterium]|nr:UDP-N-acetylglucosamine diphosphorylase/glucosamine-1-phosphate N-acetyltransferase [Deferribacteres bacterium]
MVSAVVLAAGLGTRMKSRLPKVMHRLGRKTLIECVLDTAFSEADEVVVVTGYRRELVEDFLRKRYPSVKFAVQHEQLGTAHAVKSALPEVEGDVVIIMPGDMPFVRRESLRRLVEALDEGFAGAVLVAELSEPAGYGRVVEKNGCVLKIVEEADATEEEKRIKRVNTGVYAFKKDLLEKALDKVKNDNRKGEYYLTDVVEILSSSGYKIKAVEAVRREGMGINSRRQLAEAYRERCREKAYQLMEQGVTILSPENTFIDEDVEVGIDTVIHPFVFIEGKTVIGEGCEIKPFSVIRDSRISDNVVINEHSVIEGAVVDEGVSIGPFARIRPETRLMKGSKIGNFVEVKKSVIGENSKANHLAYIGDAEVGSGVNIGAGTITCNYDGVKKHKTVIEDGVFIGSDTQLVAPVRVGKGALIGAGSTITKDVPPDSLAITRAPMKVLKGRGIEDYRKRKYGIKE